MTAKQQEEGRSMLVNGEPQAPVANVLALLDARGIAPDEKGVAVAVNGAVVPRAAWDDTALAAGDEIEIVRPFKGG